MADEPQNVIDEVTERAGSLRANRLQAAQAVEGDFLIEQEEASIQREQERQKTNALTRVGKAALAGFNETMGSDVGAEVAIRIDAASKAYETATNSDKEILGSQALFVTEMVAQELTRMSTRFNDENWNPRQNQDQKEYIEQTIEDLGLDIESSEASRLMSSRSQYELDLGAEWVRQTQENFKAVSDAGGAGNVAFFTAAMFDLDVLAGAGVFKGIRQAKNMSVANRMVKEGVLSLDEAKALANTSSRGQNIITGIEAGATSALVVEGTRSTINPSVNSDDVVGALVMSSMFGGTIGGSLKPRTAEKVAENIAFNRMMKANKERADNPSNPDFNDAMKFTEEAEGGIADVDGDRGGYTVMGISSKWFPEQAAESERILKEKGPRAQRRYNRRFFKGEFWDKVVTPDMNSAQAKVMFDTAVAMGAGTAKKLYKQAKGDVNKFLDLREQRLRKIAENPEQGQFLDGWVNRVRNLRDSVLPNKTDVSPILSDSEHTLDPSRSIGAGAFEEAPVNTPESSERILNETWDWLDENPDIEAAFNAAEDFVQETSSPAARMVQKYSEQVYKGIKKTPFISDYDRLVRDGGSIGKRLAYELLDSPVGQVVNNRSANNVSDLVQRQAAVEYAPNARYHYSQWAADRGIKKFSHKYHFNGQTEFGRELQLYRETIHAGKQPDPNTHASVVAASEDLDRAFSKSLDNMKKYGVEGFEDVEFKAGYTPHSWRGDKFSKIEYTPGVGSGRVIAALQRGILDKSPELDEQMAFIYAVAIRNHATNKTLGNPIGPLGSVSDDGLVALQRAIEENGLHLESGQTAEEMARGILFKDSERGTAKSSRRRIDIDMTTPIQGTNFTLLDLVDNDVYALADRQVRTQANYAGLANSGIQLRDRAIWKQAAIDEARSTGRDAEAAAKVVDDIFSYFGEGAFAGGTGPVAGRLNKLAILSFLPQLGITQTAELGVAMSVGGIKAYQKYAGQTMKDMLKGVDNDLLDSLSASNKFVGDHHTWVRTDHLDDVQLNPQGGYGHLLRVGDTAMDAGLRGLGNISGFYKVNEFMHRVSALTMNNYMVTSILKGKDSARLRSMGVDDEFRALVKSKYDQGSIKLDEDGHVTDMGIEGWSVDEAELLQMITRRNMDQMVQKARRGEAHAWQYDSVGSLFSSLKSFTFTAAQKQLIRNGRLADTESFNMLLATTLTAGLAYTAKQIVNGNAQNLTTEKIAVGALNWSSLLSPAMMAIDPLSYLLGADKIPGSPFPINDWRYAHNGLISMPAGISAANNLLGLGRIPADILSDGDIDRETINAIKAIPLIGRSYPMIPVLEALEND